jgi:hypothetical protein
LSSEWAPRLRLRPQWTGAVATIAVLALVPLIASGCDPGDTVGSILNDLEDTVDEVTASAARRERS